MSKLIEILEPEVISNRVKWQLLIDGQRDSFVTTVSDNVAEYLTTDRIDSVVGGLLIFAVRNGYDFKSNLPITDELHYTLSYHLMPAIGKNAHTPLIIAPTVVPAERIGKIVATGISCGVDSLYTVATHTKLPNANGNISHLAFFDAGSHHSDKVHSNTKEGRRKLAKEFAHKNGFGYFEVSTTLPELIARHTIGGYSHIENHTFLMMHCVLTLTKGIQTYYYSSGHDYNDFNCNYIASGNYDASLYDLLTLMSASFGDIKFVSAGGNVTRLNKIQSLSKYPPAYNSLNVCVSDVDNCGKCFKCARTMLELDAIGMLSNFVTVFDVAYYHQNKKWYLEHAYVESLKGDVFMKEILPYFRQEMTLPFKLLALSKKVVSVIKNRL